jgi:hypothetical protein
MLLRPLSPEERIKRLLRYIVAIANGTDGIPCCGINADDSDWLAALAQARAEGRWP